MGNYPSGMVIWACPDCPETRIKAKQWCKDQGYSDDEVKRVVTDDGMALVIMR